MLTGVSVWPASAASALAMTYIDQRRCLWPFGRRHCVAASNAVPAEHRVFTRAQYLVAEVPRILNKKPRTANADRGVGVAHD